MSAPALAPRRRRLQGRRRSAARGFDTPPGVLVAVCGLHGGAGATTTAAALAQAAAGRCADSHVVAVEADTSACELAEHLGVESPWSLGQLAALAAAGRRPEAAPLGERADGLRVLASARAGPQMPDESAVHAVLVEASRAHALVIVDAGPLHAPAATACLRAADLVLWVARSDRLEVAARRLQGPLARPARRARWVLAIVDGRAKRAALGGLADDLQARVALPADVGRRPEAADRLLELVERTLA